MALSCLLCDHLEAAFCNLQSQRTPSCFSLAKAPLSGILMGFRANPQHQAPRGPGRKQLILMPLTLAPLGSQLSPQVGREQEVCGLPAQGPPCPPCLVPGVLYARINGGVILPSDCNSVPVSGGPHPCLLTPALCALCFSLSPAHPDSASVGLAQSLPLCIWLSSPRTEHTAGGASPYPPRMHLNEPSC